MANIYRQIAEELGVREQQVEATVTLLDGGATVPFVARYRKEITGALDDAQLRPLEALAPIGQLVDHLLGRRIIGAFTGNAATEIVDDNLRAVLCEVESVGAAKSATCAGYQGHLAIKSNCHETSPSKN